MSIAGLGNNALGNAEYDFTNMTRKQELAASGQLYSEGKITEQQNATLIGLAVDSAPFAGQELSASDSLESNISRNYIDLIRENVQSLKATAGSDSGQQRSLATDESLLKILESYGQP